MYSLLCKIFACLSYLPHCKYFFLFPSWYRFKYVNEEKKKESYVFLSNKFWQKKLLLQHFLYFYINITFPLPLKGFPLCYTRDPTPFWLYLLQIDNCFYKIWGKFSRKKKRACLFSLSLLKFVSVMDNIGKHRKYTLFDINYSHIFLTLSLKKKRKQK